MHDDTGYIYILTNPSIVGWCKIAISTKPWDILIQELNTPDVPTPFEIFAAIETNQLSLIRQITELALEFNQFQVNPESNFVHCSPEELLVMFRGMTELNATMLNTSVLTDYSTGKANRALQRLSNKQNKIKAQANSNSQTKSTREPSLSKGKTSAKLEASAKNANGALSGKSVAKTKNTATPDSPKTSASGATTTGEKSAKGASAAKETKRAQKADTKKAAKTVTTINENGEVVVVKPKKQILNPPFRFSMIGIKPGTTLTFLPTSINVTVYDDNKISYKDEIYSLSGFTRKFMPVGSRYDKGSYQGPLFFLYKGKRLTDWRKEGDVSYLNDPRLEKRLAAVSASKEAAQKGKVGKSSKKAGTKADKASNKAGKDSTKASKDSKSAKSSKAQKPDAQNAEAQAAEAQAATTAASVEQKAASLEQASATTEQTSITTEQTTATLAASKVERTPQDPVATATASTDSAVSITDATAQENASAPASAKA